MEGNHVLVNSTGPVGVMTFNRPRRLNTLDVAMLEALEHALAELEADSQLRAIVITGCDDRTFMAGGDIADLARRKGLQHFAEFGELVQRVFRRFECCPKPTIAAVNGWVLGGGLELMLTTDIRLMAEEAKLGLPEIKLGLFPGGGGSQRLMRQISLCQAKWMMFTGDTLDANEALVIGLINRVVPRERLMGEAMAVAQRIGEKSPIALKMLKQSMLHGADMPLPAALAYETSNISLVFDSEDAHEGCNAFLQKRPPAFSGK